MARIRVANPTHVLRLGMVAEARIQGDRMLDVLTLPGEAVVHDPQGATIVFVYFPDKKRAYAKRVEVGSVYGQEIQIRGGLSGDEMVVLAGQERLREGAAVEASVVETPPEAK
jgi:multidrug efflux pump subunit AcrA (membrane-fusion protein)